MKKQIISEEFLRMQKLAGLITESEYNNKLNEEEKKFEEVFDAYEGYHVSSPDKAKIEQIKSQLGISDDDIMIGYYEMQEDRSYWFLHIKINTNALPADKKSTFKDIVKKIVKPEENKDNSPKAPNDAKVERKPKNFFKNMFSKIKSKFFEGNLNENEDKIMVDSTSLASYIDEMISLSDDMEYTPDMVQALQDLKDELSNGEMSVENALDIIQQTIDITGDDIDAVESLGQAVDYDNDIINAARNIKGLD